MDTLKINEVFTSIQGEGVSVGCQAIFIRFSGCALHCGFCDTDHGKWLEVPEEDLLILVLQELATLGYPAFEEGFKLKDQLSVVLTGGEPLLQVTDSLVSKLVALGLRVSIETSGAQEILSGGRKHEILRLLSECDELVVSPKVQDTSESIISMASCLKILCPIEDVEGLTQSTIREFVEATGYGTNFVFQPITPGLITNWKFNDNVRTALALAARWGLKYEEEWQVIPQVHKFLNVR